MEETQINNLIVNIWRLNQKINDLEAKFEALDRSYKRDRADQWAYVIGLGAQK